MLTRTAPSTLGTAGGGTWRDPLRISQYVAVSILYFLGLLAFHTHTGLLDSAYSAKTGNSLTSALASDSSVPVFDAEDARQYLKLVSHPDYSGPSGPLFRYMTS